MECGGSRGGITRRAKLPCLAQQGGVCLVTRKIISDPPGKLRLDMTKGVLLRAGLASNCRVGNSGLDES